MAEQVRIGIDLGGTKIEGLALDESGRELARLRVPTPQHDYPATVKAIVDVVDDLERRIGGIRSDREPTSVGVGIPGTVVRATGLVKNANSTWLNGMPYDARTMRIALQYPRRRMEPRQEPAWCSR
jgi:fructokinase